MNSTTNRHWTLDDIAWDQFDPAKVSPEILKLMKAAALVEYNGNDYAAYLRNVFPDDHEFQAETVRWAEEETQHGAALGRWCELADPDFSLEDAFKRFTDCYSIPVESENSVRGSRSGELVARCIVEVGTSSYYGSLGDSIEEPVLKQVCANIAADELRHYKLFYSYLRRYLEKEQISKLKRLVISLGRFKEIEDDELAYAYYAANAPEGAAYDRKVWGKEYINRSAGYYSQYRVQRGAAMIAKAAGINPQLKIVPIIAKLGYSVIRRKAASYSNATKSQAAA